MNGIRSNEKFIFYLQLNDSIDRPYLKLAAYFKDWGLTLVPIMPDDVVNTLGNKGQTLICLTDTLAKQKKFDIFRKRFLDFSLRSKSLSLFHISSFASPKEWIDLIRKEQVSFQSLPVPYTNIIESAAEFYLKKYSKTQSWPGGRRARLPEALKDRSNS